VIPDALPNGNEGQAQLSILFENEHLLAINKPSGYLVHHSQWAGPDELPSIQQILRNQIDQHVHPVHRLDRQTSGVLLFAKTKEAEQSLRWQFESRAVNKTYLCVARGITAETFTISKALKKEGIGQEQEAITHFEKLSECEIPIPNKRYPSSRYSLLKAFPETGRMHQIRRHLAHARHPIIGDKKYGDNCHNAILLQHFQIDRLLLHHQMIQIKYHKDEIKIYAPLPKALISLFFEFFGLDFS
jgi:tRNA pseudouridine65 synthase